MLKKFLQKVNKKILPSIINLVIPVISFVIAIVAIFQAQYSIKVAQEANQIARDALLPQMTVNYLYPFADYRDYVKEPCKRSDGSGYWKIEYAPVFDITNTGNKANSLTDIDYPIDVITIVTGGGTINVKAYYSFFGSLSNFNEWFTPRDFSPQSGNILQSLESSIVVGPPITIEPGETKRLLLHGITEIDIKSKVTLLQVHQNMDGPFWTTNIKFNFGDGTTKKVSTFVPRPFQEILGTSGEYQSCPEQ